MLPSKRYRQWQSKADGGSSMGKSGENIDIQGRHYGDSLYTGCSLKSRLIPVIIIKIWNSSDILVKVIGFR